MQVQNLEPTAGTLQDFQNFCEPVESVLDKLVTDDKSNKMSRENINKKRRCNNNDDEGKKHFCMLHGHNPTHGTKQCRTLKKEAEKHKKTRKMRIVKTPSARTLQPRKKFTRSQYFPKKQ